jgi:hypothetical protein
VDTYFKFPTKRSLDPLAGIAIAQQNDVDPKPITKSLDLGEALLMLLPTQRGPFRHMWEKRRSPWPEVGFLMAPLITQLIAKGAWNLAMFERRVWRTLSK